MELTKCKLGELITQRREKNDGSDLPICGVSKDGLIPPKQKDADTSIYNVFYRDDFIFNPARMELNSIAINDMYDRAICSSLYEVFYVHRTDLLLPHYLELIIRQKWFTRYCKFLGQGSAREYCRFGNISEIEIEFPPIEEQQKIVEYNTAIENRIALKQKINDNLEAQAQALFTSWFVNFEPFDHSNDEDGKALPPDNWENGTLGSCIDFLNGYAFKSDDLLDEPTDNCYDVFKMGNIKKGGGLNYDGTKSWIEREFCIGLERFVLRTGDILMSMTDMKENVALLGHTALMDIENKYIVNQRVGLLRPNGYLSISPYQIYLLTNNPAFLRELRRHAHIGVQVNLSKEDIVNSRLIYAPKEVNVNFENLVRPIFKAISLNNAEILKLNDVAIQIQAQLSR